MTDGFIKVPTVTVDGKNTDCEVIVRSGEDYYQQRVHVMSSALSAGAATSALQQTDALTDAELRATPVTTIARAHYQKHGTTDPYPVQGADGCLFTMEYLTAIGAGYVDGHVQFHSIGYNPDIDAAREDICEWGGTYIPPPAGGIQMRVVSTSAADDGSPAGTGVWTVEINYLNAAGVECTETVTLNGTTPVSTVATNIWRVNYFHTATADTATAGYGEAAGDITLKNVAGTVTYAQISAAGNFSRHGFFTMPAGRKGCLIGGYVSTGGTTTGKFIHATLRATCSHDGVLTPGIFQFKRMILALDSQIMVPFAIPIYIPALCDIKFSAVDEANAFVSTYVEGWMETV